jgi:hypothetical protein
MLTAYTMQMAQHSTRIGMLLVGDSWPGIYGLPRPFR